MMRRILSPFRGLRGRLTLTYALVTVGALLALELLLFVGILLLSSYLRADEQEYLSDVIFTLGPQATRFLENDPSRPEALQAWAEEVYASGYASLPPQSAMDAPAAPIVADYPLVVIAADGTLLAQAPEAAGAETAYTLPTVAGAERVINTALGGNFSPLELYTFTPDGNYFMAVPLGDFREEQTPGAILLVIEPPPPLLLSYLPILLQIMLASGLLLLLGVAPFGILFGFIMSRNLTRRLDDLASAAAAWGEGNFSVVPRDEAQDEIGRLGQQMRQMARRIQTLLQTRQELAALEERNRLARELHDTVKQQSFATLMQLRAAKNLLAQNPEDTRQHLEEAENLVKQSQQDLKLLIAELRPSALEGKGLPVALADYVETWSRYATIEAALAVTDGRPLPLPVEQALYRVAQEALSNVARHSAAERVSLSLAYAPRQVVLRVEDDGRGFAPADVDQGDAEAGFGLQSMRQRLGALGGALRVASAPGGGTRIVATVPLEPGNGAAPFFNEPSEETEKL